MTKKSTKKLLEQALLHEGEMRHELYEHELEEISDELKSSMAQDKDEYIFAVTENGGDVAMVLIEKSGQVHINEQARERLQALWPVAYESNMEMLIPGFAQQLKAGEIPVNGVKTTKTVQRGRA